VYTRASLTDILARILARKIARVGQVGGQLGQVGQTGSTTAADCGKLNGRHADILATILAKMSVSVSVSVPWNSSLMAVSLLTVNGPRNSDPEAAQVHC